MLCAGQATERLGVAVVGHVQRAAPREQLLEGHAELLEGALDRLRRDEEKGDFELALVKAEELRVQPREEGRVPGLRGRVERLVSPP